VAYEVVQNPTPWPGRRSLLRWAVLLSAAVVLASSNDLRAQAPEGQQTPATASTPTAEPTLDVALSVPPAVLANSYLLTQTRLAFISMLSEMKPHVTGSLKIVTPEGEIDASNYPDLQKKFEHRQAIYRQAIEKRGFATGLSGEYFVSSVKPSCAKSGSMLLRGASEKVFDKLTLAQDGFDMTMTAFVAADPSKGLDKDFELPLEGVAVENALAFVDFANSDYHLNGVITPNGIELRPDPDVLEAWPKWASPPAKRDLENCVLILERKR